MRRAILVVSAGAAVILGLDRVGVTPIAPGHDTRFSWRIGHSVAPQVLSLTTDAGDLHCWLEVTLRTQGSPNPRFEARLADGHPLAVESKQVHDREWMLQIFEPGRVPSERAKFRWPSGIALDIVCPTSILAVPPLSDWVVYLHDKDLDSLSRATWRRRWFWISSGLIVLAVIGAVYGAWPQKEAISPLLVTPEWCITGIIAQLEGSTARESALMQDLIRRVVVQGLPAEMSLNSIAWNKPTEKWTVWFKARREFITRLSFLIGELDRYRQRVSK